MEDWIISNPPDKPIKFNYEIFTRVLDISNYGPRVFEIKIILKIGSLMND